MPKLRTPRRRSIPATPEQREDAAALLWRMEQIRNWKEAVHREAWRQTRADGSGHCDPAGFDAAEARLQAAGVDRPPRPGSTNSPPWAGCWPRKTWRRIKGDGRDRK